MRADDMSSTGAVAVTVTASWTPAGFSSKSSASSWPTAIVIAVYSMAPKPDFCALIVYEDGLR